jgi:hypothetical protein
MNIPNVPLAAVAVLVTVTLCGVLFLGGGHSRHWLADQPLIEARVIEPEKDTGILALQSEVRALKSQLADHDRMIRQLLAGTPPPASRPAPEKAAGPDNLRPASAGEQGVATSSVMRAMPPSPHRGTASNTITAGEVATATADVGAVKDPGAVKEPLLASKEDREKRIGEPMQALLP